MRGDQKHIRACIRNLGVLDSLDRPSRVDSQCRVEERLVRLATASNVKLPKLHRAGADRDTLPNGIRQREGYVRRDGEVRRRADLCIVVAEVASDEDEGVWIDRGAHEPGNMAMIVTGGVEEVERAVTEKVIGAEGAQPRRCILFRKIDLSYGSPSIRRTEISGFL